MKAAETKFIVSEPEILDSVLLAATQAGIGKERVWAFDNLGQAIPTGMTSWRSLMNHGEQDWVRFNNQEAAHSTTAMRLFSSGTTGLPKAVTITHANLVAQHELTLGCHPRPYQVRRPTRAARNAIVCG